MIRKSQFKLRPASKRDFTALAAFLEGDCRVYRHLDWRTPLEWLGFQPFWILEKEDRILAVLACPPDPPGVAWVRLFAVAGELPPGPIWKILFDQACKSFGDAGLPLIAALGLHDWFRELISKHAFIHQQDIVVLGWNGKLPPEKPASPDVIIRPMLPSDLDETAAVDHSAFHPLWQNSLDAMQFAIEKSSHASVAEYQGGVVGYQITTFSNQTAHLARLAVRPDLQRRNIGYTLVRDLLQKLEAEQTWQVTVNTQHDNHASLALYHSLGFFPNGEHFPVYTYQG